MVLIRVFLFSLIASIVVSCSTKNEHSEINQEEEINVKYIFTLKCASCHGADGKLGVSGAKDLSISILSDIELKDIISNGKNGMPSFGSSLSLEEQNEIIKYVKTLRK
jgi:mono/diheme cytochrome c family protein